MDRCPCCGYKPEPDVLVYQQQCWHGMEVIRLPLADVLYFRSEAKYTVAVTAEREHVLTSDKRFSLRTLRAKYSAQLLAISAKRLVPRARIRSLCRGEMWLDGVDLPLKVSRRYVPAVAQALRGLDATHA